MSKDKREEDAADGSVWIEGRGLVRFRQWFMKSYYYMVTIPQKVNEDTTIPLFCEHLGEKKWTNFTRDRKLPRGHEAMIFRVSLAVVPARHTMTFDIMEAMQRGHLTILLSGAEWLSEPLSFFAVNLLGEIAFRNDDPLGRLAVEVALTTSEDGAFTKEARRIMEKIAGMPLPPTLPESYPIDGQIQFRARKELYNKKPFDLVVLLHTITSKPLE